MTRWWIWTVAGLAAALGGCGGGNGTADVPDAVDHGGGDADADADADTNADTGTDTAADTAADPGTEAEADVVADTVGDGDGSADVDAGPPAGSCATYAYTLHEGHNTGFVVDGQNRAFELLLPDTIHSADGPWPVVFLYHGYGEDTTQVTDLVASSVSDADHPFIGVAPVSVPLDLSTTPLGFEWDMLQWTADQNLDLDMFDQVLGCLDEAFGVDHDRVYSMGFSAGAIMTNLLSVARSEVVAAIASFSGAYFSDPTQQICLGTLCTTWPEYAATNKFPALLVWGGPTDIYVIAAHVLSIDFNTDTLASIDYLTGHGHNVVGCEHALGHNLPPDLAGPQFLEFLFDHPKGTTPDPYATALPGDFPDYCTYHAAD